MGYLFLILTAIVQSSQNFFSKQYSSTATHSNPYTFAAVSSFFAAIISLISSGFHLDFPLSLLPYCITFGIMYVCAIDGVHLAISSGPLSLTTLFVSYSMVIPMLHGVLFLNEGITPTGLFGTILLLLSIILINIKRNVLRLSMKWFLFVLIAFIGNGVTSTILKMQQVHFGGLYKCEFMIGGIGIAFLIMAAIAWRSSPHNILYEIKDCLRFAACSGTANGLGNILLMFSTAFLPSAILFPLNSAIGLSLMFFVSVLFYKEKLSNTQKIGYLIGVLSIAFLNM